jgi:SAM-dependent methyltransferase
MLDLSKRGECPACGAISTARLLYMKQGYPIHRCTNCGLGSTELNGRFDLSEIYSSHYFSGGRSDGYSDYLGSEPVLRREFQLTLRNLHAAGRSAGRLFEVGCAFGFFLMEARSAFEVSGVEVCAEAAAYCQNQGLDVDAGGVTEDRLAQRGPLDVVVMLDVIEHLADPLEVLRMAHRQMNPGAHLLITTGDWESFLSRCMGRWWRLMTPPQHLFFFSRKTITAMLGRAGFRVVRIDRPSKRVPVSLVLFQFARMAGLQPKNVRALSGISLPVNLLDAMRIIAVRTEDYSRPSTSPYAATQSPE